MKLYATCPKCGKKFCRAKEGSEIEMQCPSCKEQVVVVVTDGAVTVRCVGNTISIMGGHQAAATTSN